MHQDRIKWNEKYRRADAFKEPSPIVKDFCAMAPRGRALDIAAGMGRNAVFLAKNGFTVDAVDISEEGLGKLAGRHPRVHTIRADLDLYDIPAERYSLIINIRFLNRRLFPYIREGLLPGGLLIFQSYLETPGIKTEETFCRDYL
ncbi:MAG: class I SAM-dependent methyltransferase, partial [Desulfobacterales bacterium]|nr:class I SAM-dependent methyltransferase [Desulfobacterales bacterium]